MPGNNDPSQQDSNTLLNRAGVTDATSSNVGDAVDASAIAYNQSTDSAPATRKRYRYVISDPAIRSAMVGLQPAPSGDGWVAPTYDEAALAILHTHTEILCDIRDLLVTIDAAVRPKE